MNRKGAKNAKHRRHRRKNAEAQGSIAMGHGLHGYARIGLLTDVSIYVLLDVHRPGVLGPGPGR